MLINEDARQYREKHSNAYTKSILKVSARPVRQVALNRLVAHHRDWSEYGFIRPKASNDEFVSDQIDSTDNTADVYSGSRVVLLMLALLVALVLSGVAMVVQGYQQRTQVTALADLQAERDALQAELTRLTLEHSTLTSLDRVERISQQSLGMHYPDTREIVVVNLKSE